MNDGSTHPGSADPSSADPGSANHRGANQSDARGDNAGSQAGRPPVTYLLLIRHGENEWVKSGRLAGRTPGVHLNERGREQAAGLVELLSRQPIHAIYSSPLERCLETAQPLADHLGLPIILEANLIEVNYGAWHGAELKELAKRDEWQAVQHFPSTFRFPEGESLREVQYRAASVADRLAQLHPNQVIAIFSHGDVIRTLLAHFAGTPLDLFQRVHVNPASVSTVGVFGGRPALLCVNYTAELPVYEHKAQDDKAGESAQGTPAEPAAASENAVVAAESRDVGK